MPCESGASCLFEDAWQNALDLLAPVRAVFESLFRFVGSSLGITEQNLLTLITLASLAVALWSWRRSRGKALLRRLDDMFAREDRHLRTIRSDIFEGVLRPSVGSVFDPPNLAHGPLKRIMHRHAWLSPFALSFQEQVAGQTLQRTISRLLAQRTARNRAQAQLEQLIASVYLLRSAVDATRAERVTDAGLKHEFERRALQHLDAALSLPDNDADPDALELKVYHIMRTGSLEAAWPDLQTLKDYLSDQPVSEDTERRLARVVKCEALLLRRGGDIKRAYAALSSALVLLDASYAPLRPADLLERAQIQELQTELALVQGIGPAALESREDAKTSYRAVIDLTRATSSLGGFLAWCRWRLHRETAGDVLLAAALAGFERVKILGEQRNDEEEPAGIEAREPEDVA